MCSTYVRSSDKWLCFLLIILASRIESDGLPKDNDSPALAVSDKRISGITGRAVTTGGSGAVSLGRRSNLASKSDIPALIVLLPLMVETDEILEWLAENVEEQQDEKLLRLSEILWLPVAGDVLYSVQRLDLYLCQYASSPELVCSA